LALQQGDVSRCARCAGLHVLSSLLSVLLLRTWTQTEAAPSLAHVPLQVTPSRLTLAPGSSADAGPCAHGQAQPTDAGNDGCVAGNQQQVALLGSAGPAAQAGQAGRKRKAPEPCAAAEPEGISKRQQLLGLTILTLGALTVRAWIVGTVLLNKCRCMLTRCLDIAANPAPGL